MRRNETETDMESFPIQMTRLFFVGRRWCNKLDHYIMMQILDEKKTMDFRSISNGRFGTGVRQYPADMPSQTHPPRLRLAATGNRSHKNPSQSIIVARMTIDESYTHRWYKFDNNFIGFLLQARVSRWSNFLKLTWLTVIPLFAMSAFTFGHLAARTIYAFAPSLLFLSNTQKRRN